MKDLPNAAWKAFATIGIWVGVGICATNGMQLTSDMMTAAACVTGVIWVFGDGVL